jgi:hypothetical protein
MRFFKHIAVVAAVLPLALAQYSTPPPPDSAPECSSGEHRCANNTLQVCGDDIAWQTVKECSKTAYCFAQNTAEGGGDCYPLVGGSKMQCSTIKDHRCDTNSLQECGDHGYWSTVKNCTQTAYCFAQSTVNGNGDCHPLIIGNNNQCSTTDSHRCSQNTLQICGDHGYWMASKNCTQTAYCFAQDTIDGGGDCHPLVAGLKEQCSVANEHRCQNNTLQVCTDHGYWNTSTTCTESEKCSLNSKYVDGGLCLPTNSTGDQERCKANAHRCHNNTIQDCTLREHWSTRQTCGDHQICLDNCGFSGCNPACLDFSVPRTNDTACDVAWSERCLYNPARIQTCSNSVWVDKESCPMDEYCIERSTDGRHWTATCTGPPSPSCNRPGDERCLYSPAVASARVQLCTDNLWIVKEICPKDTICWADKNFDTGDELASCETLEDLPPNANVVSKRTDQEYCDQRGFDRCAYDPDRIQHCSIGHMWMNKEFCTNGTTCLADKNPDTGVMEVACVALPYSSPPPTCTPGDLTCDANLYALRKCNANGEWETIKKCLAPGDCSIDGPGQAHCKSGGMDPPKSESKRGYSTCAPGLRACDKERRFLFTCGTDGKWESNPLQCFGAGYCRPEGWSALTCGGFPIYDGENGVCNSHCESMDYLYCIGVSLLFTLVSRSRSLTTVKDKWGSPDVIRKCLKGMCAREDVSTPGPTAWRV